MWVDEDNFGNVGILEVHIISLLHLVQSKCTTIHGLATANHGQKGTHGFSDGKKGWLVAMRIDGSNLPGHWTGVLGSRTVGGGCRDCPL